MKRQAPGKRPYKDNQRAEREMLAAAFKRARESTGQPAVYWAERLGTSTTTLSAYETGRTDIPAVLLLAFARLAGLGGAQFGFPADREYLPGNEPFRVEAGPPRPKPVKPELTLEEVKARGLPLYHSREWLVAEVERLGTVQGVAREHGFSQSTLHRYYVRFVGPHAKVDDSQS